ncbi:MULTISPECIES: twin-arginine translocase TatA/TatE family subunit [Metallosphaera]|uniref:Sec-independent protein translocase TatA n=3 Tax=Metallosphaera TaxID=41980 RepID=A4YEW6_METS5|nr:MULTISPECIES: twin-arginine translocase TatA/TatE family subunit [Metallosphaera]ABP94968.1 Sec-independent protein translocase TatA [Metallosphaera sedula DSM 5348]AIM26954.1 Sec-independent protein translocase TatA [Metallosphaera sedula]AKV73883.1 preprotein translocase subunit TatA [Metallosphaera sedula]AKV76125.1 preprotein translocase subunit TatA [Metallosphaera sedula]AKV78376.1 preprotein translocase subunit TatA [Metallosphaera sedula]
MVAINPSDIAIIIIVALVLFVGSSKIPELFRSMGRALGEFKKGRMEAEMEINQMQTQQSQPNVQQSQKTTSAEDLEKQIRDLQNQLDQLKKQQGTK